jgi:hypothetical protein
MNDDEKEKLKATILKELDAGAIISFHHAFNHDAETQFILAVQNLCAYGLTCKAKIRALRYLLDKTESETP